MISKAQLKTYRSLKIKKYRDELGLFLAEGGKCVDELCKAFELEALITEQEVGRTAIEQLSSLRTPQGVIGVFRQPQTTNSPLDGFYQLSTFNSQLILALDGIQDPGNLGTIIRTCDWFGVRDIVCSTDTADCYNPKVVQATMGALARVRIHYVDLPKWLNDQAANDKKVNIFGTLLEGKNMYEVLQSSDNLSSSIVQSSIIVMGNEGNGISEEVRRLITHPIRIPSYPPQAETSESLNVAIATAIVLSEFRRP